MRTELKSECFAIVCSSLWCGAVWMEVLWCGVGGSFMSLGLASVIKPSEAEKRSDQKVINKFRLGQGSL